MANLAVGAVYKMRTYCFQGNQAGINTRYFKVLSLTGAPASEASICSALDGTLAPFYKLLLANTALYIGTNIQNQTLPLPFPQPVGFSGNQGIGTAGATPLPGQISGIYTVQTGFAGRGFRGRVYVPFPATAGSTTTAPPLMTGAYQTQLQDLANVCVGNQTVAAGGATYAIVYGLVHSKPLALKGVFIASTAAKFGLNWATQRRRGDFGRLNTQPVP